MSCYFCENKKHRKFTTYPLYMYVSGSAFPIIVYIVSHQKLNNYDNMKCKKLTIDHQCVFSNIV